MTYEEVKRKFDKFLLENDGQFVEEVDNSPEGRNQCFDLAIRWCIYLGLSRSIFAGLLLARQIWLPSTIIAVLNFDYIDNDPYAIPLKGDMVVWNGAYNGGAGHVGIATGVGTLNWFECFVQNDPYKTRSHKQIYDYGNKTIDGWLRFKTQSPISPYKEKNDRLKIAIDRLKKEFDTDMANTNANQEQLYNGTITKVKRIAETGAL